MAAIASCLSDSIAIIPASAAEACMRYSAPLTTWSANSRIRASSQQIKGSHSAALTIKTFTPAEAASRIFYGWISGASLPEIPPGRLFEGWLLACLFCGIAAQCQKPDQAVALNFRMSRLMAAITGGGRMQDQIWILQMGCQTLIFPDRFPYAHHWGQAFLLAVGCQWQKQPLWNWCCHNP